MFKKIILIHLILIINLSALCQTNKPILHGRHWIAITGKPIGATAGSIILKEED